LYTKSFRPLGWSKYDFQLLLAAGEVVSVEKGMFVYEHGGFDGDSVFLVLEGTAGFVLLDPLPLTPFLPAAAAAAAAGKAEGTGGWGVDAHTQAGEEMEHTTDFDSSSATDTDTTTTSTPTVTAGGDGGIPDTTVDMVVDPEEPTADVPAMHLSYGRLYPGQSDSLLCREQPTPVTAAAAASGIPSRIGMVAESPLRVLRVPRGRLRSMFQSSRRLEVLAHRVDSARQERARETLAVQHQRMSDKLKEYEDLVARRIIQLMKM